MTALSPLRKRQRNTCHPHLHGNTEEQGLFSASAYSEDIEAQRGQGSLATST